MGYNHYMVSREQWLAARAVNTQIPAYCAKTAKEKAGLCARLSRYKLSVYAYYTLLERQEGKCAICSLPGGETLYIDHCPKENKVRGLLCNNCNTGLGQFFDKPELLDSARNYLMVARKIPS